MKLSPRPNPRQPRSHINTGDAGHYISLISELEARGAKVVCIYSGGLDFSGPVKEYFYRAGGVAVDAVINLTGFALVGGPASQDHPKAISTLQDLGVPYLCAVPLVFQYRRRRLNGTCIFLRVVETVSRENFEASDESRGPSDFRRRSVVLIGPVASERLGSLRRCFSSRALPREHHHHRT